MSAGDESSAYALEPVRSANYPYLSIQEHLVQNAIHVPEIFEADLTAGLYLLEDLGDLTLERKFWENLHQENVLPFYKVAIDQLAIFTVIPEREKPERVHRLQGSIRRGKIRLGVQLHVHVSF